VEEETPEVLCYEFVSMMLRAHLHQMTFNQPHGIYRMQTLWAVRQMREHERQAAEQGAAALAAAQELLRSQGREQREPSVLGSPQ
jgi:hypothetical protein